MIRQELESLLSMLMQEATAAPTAGEKHPSFTDRIEVAKTVIAYYGILAKGKSPPKEANGDAVTFDAIREAVASAEAGDGGDKSSLHARQRRRS